MIYTIEIRPEVLLEEMDKQKYKQKDLAKKLGISPSTLSYSIKRRKLSLVTATNLCEILNINLSDIQASNNTASQSSISNIPINVNYLQQELDKYGYTNNISSKKSVQRLLSTKLGKAESYISACITNGNMNRDFAVELCRYLSIDPENLYVKDYDTKQYTRINISKLREKIRETEVTATDLAKNIGRKPNYIFDLMHSDGIIEKQDYLALCKEFNVDLGYFSYTTTPIFYDKGVKIPSANTLKQKDINQPCCYFDGESFKEYCRLTGHYLTGLSLNVLGMHENYLSGSCNKNRINKTAYNTLRQYFELEENETFKMALSKLKNKISNTVVEIDGAEVFSSMVAYRINLPNIAAKCQVSTSEIRQALNSNLIRKDILDAINHELDLAMNKNAENNDSPINEIVDDIQSSIMSLNEAISKLKSLDSTVQQKHGNLNANLTIGEIEKAKLTIEYILSYFD